jgi:hypothetical protein
VRRGNSRWWLAVVGLGILAVGLYVASVRLAPDSVPGILRDEVARPSPRQEPPQAIAAAADSTAMDATPPAEPEPPDSLVSAEDLVPPDFAAAIAQTEAPTPVIAALGGPGRLTFEADTITVSESAGVVPLRVVRRGGAAGPVSFGWRTLDDSAVADLDYAGLGTIQGSIGPGETSKTLLIPIVSDAITESTELFDVVIEDPTAGATLGAITQVTVIIVDDD